MNSNFFIITNNPLVHNELGKSFLIELIEGNHRDVLVLARDYIYEGHGLLTHPLAGSVKPNETPYKSIAITREKQKLDLESVEIISNSIQVCEKFSLNPREYKEEGLEDLGQIDYSLILSAIKSSI